MKKLMFTLAAVSCAGLAQADDGTFMNAAGGAWSDKNNWKDGVIASGAGAIATISAELAGNATIVLPEEGLTIGSLVVENTSSSTSSAKWILSGGSMTFDKGEADGAASVVDVKANAQLQSATVTDLNDVAKKGAGVWTMTVDGAFKDNSVVVQDGKLAYSGLTFRDARITLDKSAGLSPTVELSGAENKSNGPYITVKAGTGRVTLRSDGWGKVTQHRISFADFFDFDVESGTLTACGNGYLKGTGETCGFRKVGSGLLQFGTSPDFSGSLVLSQGTISQGDNYIGDKVVAVTIGDADSEGKDLKWQFSKKSNLPSEKVSFHVTEFGRSATFDWSGNKASGVAAKCPFVLDRTVNINANVNSGVQNTFAGVFSGVGGINFGGNGVDRTLALTGANTYQGGTSINKVTVKVGTTSALGTGDVSIGATGKLAYDADGIDAIADAAVVRVTTGGVIDFGTHAVTEKVQELIVDGAKQAAGIWGAVGSGATHEADWITGSGFLKVAGMGFTVSVR